MMNCMHLWRHTLTDTTAIHTALPSQMLQNTWREIKYCFDVCRATNRANISTFRGMTKNDYLLSRYLNLQKYSKCACGDSTKLFDLKTPSLSSVQSYDYNLQNFGLYN